MLQINVLIVAHMGNALGAGIVVAVRQNAIAAQTVTHRGPLSSFILNVFYFLVFLFALLLLDCPRIEALLSQYFSVYCFI